MVNVTLKGLRAQKRRTVADVANLGKVLDLEVQDGALERLGPMEVAVSADEAVANGWAMGTSLPMRFVDGATAAFTIGAIYDVGDVAGDYVISRAAWPPMPARTSTPRSWSTWRPASA